LIRKTVSERPREGGYFDAFGFVIIFKKNKIEEKELKSSYLFEQT